ncbi:DUF1214 domain-containing protein, partial [Caballeronia arationis]|uniref:DUF1214 domain-containing protein n=2 Tax=Caballeronia arationis TaxID=1777142 RepID=UPI000AA7EBBE
NWEFRNCLSAPIRTLRLASRDSARPTMYDNAPEETRYIYTDFDSTGQRLSGVSRYTVTFAKGAVPPVVPPVNGFWSLTVYNKEHLFEANRLNRFSLGTKNKSLKYNPDGSLTLYFQNESPGSDKESNWVPAPKDEFSLYIRAYWPKAAILDGTWTPPPVLRVN